MKSRARIAAAALASSCVAAGALFVGCSLGLDESKIRDAVADAGAPPGDENPITTPDAGPRDVTAPDVAAPDAPSGCTVDAECAAPNACLTGRCDTTTRTCLFDVCKQATACSRAACTVATHTCAAPSAVPFQAGSFRVQGAVACGGSASKCLAAASGFVFVGTANGVVAYSAEDPTNAAPPAIAITGLPFVPTRLVASGMRVYVLGGLVGKNVQIAWIDVPADPFAPSIAAHTVLVASTLTAAPDMFAALPGAGVYVFSPAESGTEYPTAIAIAPLTDFGALTMFPNGSLVMGTAPVAASGGRLIFYRWVEEAQQLDELFTVVSGAGTGAPVPSAETNVSAAMGQAWGTQATVQFASGPNGALAWGAPAVQIGAIPAGTIAARVALVLTDATSATPSAAIHADLEAYDPSVVGIGQPVVGPMAWVDATTVLALAQVPANLATTSVQVARNSDGGAAVVANRRAILPIESGRTGAAAAGGYAYVLAADADDGATVYVFAPSCP